MAQGVNLTPQLLQSIRLLQLTSQQLATELQQTLERNPLLEQDEPELETESPESDIAGFEAAAWDELPEPAFLSGMGSNGSFGGLDDDATARIAEGESSDMRQRLLSRLALEWAAGDLPLAAFWLDRCDDNGYLEQSLDALLAEGETAFPGRGDDLSVVRQRLLHGEWPGMAATDPTECLSAQLRMLAASDARSLALRVLADHVDLLAAHDDAALAAALSVDVAAVRDAVALILSLRAHPVEAPASIEDSHIVPDVVTWHAGGAWRVALGRHTTPRVRIS
ncbi:MAG: RNA polymerase sigma-54 factor, partial [Luteimonas sp.]